jgi:hypothetical protein
MMREDELLLAMADPWWRISNLYWIVNKDGKPVRFEPNEEQRDFYANLHTRNSILKARQLGFSTLMQIIALDQCVFNDNFTANTIADTLPNAGKLFRKAVFAYERLPTAIRESRPLKSKSASEMVFANGSSFSVGTSARGGTVQLLHVSEMGKIAKKYPEKAREIVTGAFEAVPLDGVIVVESTAEGNGGEFFDICDAALKKRQEKQALTQMDYRLHFYPWWKRDEYKISAATVSFGEADKKYFREVESKIGRTLSPEQRAWWIKKRETLKRDMKREYPATPQEAFEQAVEGAIYGDEMTFLRERSRICELPIDPLAPVNTFWDLGSNDHTAIWLHQQIGQWHHFIGYMHDTHVGLRSWWQRLLDFKDEHGFDRWGGHFLPHDGDAERQGEEIESAYSILTNKVKVKKVEIVPRISDLATGIDLTRDAMQKSARICQSKCVDGIKCLDSYQYKWDDKRGMWSAEPYHNWASNGSDAFRQWAQSLKKLNPADTSDSLAAFKNRPRSWR